MGRHAVTARRATPGLSFMVAAVLAACNASAASPSPSAGVPPSHTPSPQPTAPPDPAQRFNDLIVGPDFRGHADVTGTSTSGGHEIELGGSIDIDGDRAYSRAVVVVGGVERQTEILLTDTTYASRRVDGPWIDAPRETARPILSEILRSVAPYERAGSETVDGQSFHRLVPLPNPALGKPGAFGYDSVAEFFSAVEVLVTDDGQPRIVRFELSFISPEGEETLVALEYDFPPEATVRFPSVSERWTRFTSERFPYSIAHPVAWTEHLDEDHEWFSDGSSEVHVHLVTDAVAMGRDAWLDMIQEALEQQVGEIEGVEPITVAGVERRRYDMHTTWEGIRVHFMLVAIDEGPRAWVVRWFAPAGHEGRDRQAFDRWLSTFEPDADSLANVWVLEPGECFRSLPITPTAGTSILFVGGVDGFAKVDCWESHTGEIIEVLGPDQASACEAAFERYVGTPLAESTLAVAEFMPVSADRVPEGVGGLCVVVDPAGHRTGSVAGTGE